MTVQFDADATHDELQNAVIDTVQKEWNYALPHSSGFRRILSPSTNTKSESDPDWSGAEDFHGNARHYGRNDIREFGDHLPFSFISPAALDDRMWSLRLGTADYSPASASEAKGFARSAEQVMVSLGNSWIIWNAAHADSPPSSEELVNQALINFSAVVEYTACCALGKTDKEIGGMCRDKKGLLPLAKEYSGSDTPLVRILRGPFETIPTLRGFYLTNEPSIRIVAGPLDDVRNARAHRPPPLNQSVIDRGSIGRIVTLNEAREISRLAYAMTRDICERENLVEVNALPIP